MERRLAAILAADVAGYSLLMNTDEDATYGAWRSARNEVIDPGIEAGQGRIVKHTGDGFLAEFPTVLAAVECAVVIQQEMGLRNEPLAKDQRFQFRIGINLGDIIVDNEDIHGDGVNIAARLESIAEAGGICISADVYRQVRNKSGFHFHDLGEHQVKNIQTPIQVYSVSRGKVSEGLSDTTPLEAAPSAAKVNEGENPFKAMLENISGSGQPPLTLLVGRASENQILDEAFQEAQQGSGNIVLIRGDPGIGKSSLASSFAEKVKGEAAWVVYGQCHETLGSPPFWPWLQILRNLQLTDDSLGLSPAAIFESLAAAESKQQGRITSMFGGSGDGGGEQFLLFSKIANVLAQYASQRPLILVIDDLHWADKSSLLLLSHICRKLSQQAILVIGTYRDIEITRKHPLFESLGEISRQANLRRIALKGLSESEVSGVIENTVSATLSAEVLRSLYEKTEGNPLFVSEVARILQQEKSHPGLGEVAVEIPEGIQEAIGRRLNQLSEECNELLPLATVIGRTFGLQVLNQLVPESEQIVLLEVLEEAVKRGIVEETNNVMAGFRFCHVLIRDILYDELSLAKKIILHRKVADALVRLREGGSEISAGEIARHYYHALQGGQGDNAVTYAIEAAEYAKKLSAYDEAREYYELVIDVLNVDEGRYKECRAEIYYRIVECIHAVGSPTLTTANACQLVLDEARKSQQYEYFVRAACRMVYVERSPGKLNNGLNAIDEALSYLAEGDLIARADLLAYRAMSLCFNGRRSEAEQVATDALSVAADCGHDLVLSNCLCIALLVLRGRPEKLSERIRLGEQALAVSIEARRNSGPVLNDPQEWLILTYQELGDMGRVKTLIRQLEASIDHTYSYKAHYFSANACSYLALYEGCWQLAETLIEDAKELGSGRLDDSAEGIYGAQMFLLNRELGRLPMVYGALKRLLANDHSGVWAPGLLATYTDLGLLEDARAIFEQLAANDFKPLGEGELFLTCLVYMIETCVELADSENAGALYQRMMPYSGQMVSHPTAVCHGPADMYLGMLSSLKNNLDEAQQLFVKAATLCEKSAPNMWQAHIKYRHAQVLKRHNFSGGKSEFNRLIEEARSSAQNLGMVNLLAKIEILEAENQKESKDKNNGLTRKELEVLQLIVQGKSNKYIALELNRSLATIATHVRAILNKTHTANRTEAAAFAAVHDIFKAPSRGIKF